MYFQKFIDLAQFLTTRDWVILTKIRIIIILRLLLTKRTVRRGTIARLRANIALRILVFHYRNPVRSVIVLPQARDHLSSRVSWPIEIVRNCLLSWLQLNKRLSATLHRLLLRIARRRLQNISGSTIYDIVLIRWRRRILRARLFHRTRMIRVSDLIAGVTLGGPLLESHPRRATI